MVYIIYTERRNEMTTKFDDHFFTQYEGRITLFKPTTDWAIDWWNENIESNAKMYSGGYMVDSEDIEKIISLIEKV